MAEDIAHTFDDRTLTLPLLAQRCAGPGQPADYCYRALDRMSRAGILDGEAQPGRTAARLYTLSDLVIAKVCLIGLTAMKLPYEELRQIADCLRNPPLAMAQTPRATLEECFFGWRAGEWWMIEIHFLRHAVTGERRIVAGLCRPMLRECLVPATLDDDGNLVPLSSMGWTAEVISTIEVNRLFTLLFTDPVRADRVH